MTTGPSQAPDRSSPPTGDSQQPEATGALGQPEEEEGERGGSGRSLLDRLRGTGVGVEDPNIAADADLTDVLPDPDPAAGGGGHIG